MTAADARLAVVASGQAGAFSRSQAIAAGLSAAQIERRVRAHVWERALPHVYGHASTPVSLAFRHWAAVLWAGPGGALSHTSAAAVWRIRVPLVDRPEIAVPRTRAPRSSAVVVHRVVGLDDRDRMFVDGLPVIAPARTVIDLAGVLGEADLEIAVASAWARGVVTVRAVGDRLDEVGSVGRPGAARLRALLVALGRGGVGSSARMAG